MFRSIVIAAALVTGMSLGAQAQTKPLNRGQPWAKGCEDAATTKIQREIKGPARVQFESDTELEWKVSATETGVRGDGKYQMATGDFQPFRFECVYDTGAGKVTNVRYTLL